MYKQDFASLVGICVKPILPYWEPIKLFTTAVYKYNIFLFPQHWKVYEDWDKTRQHVQIHCSLNFRCIHIIFCDWCVQVYLYTNTLSLYYIVLYTQMTTYAHKYSLFLSKTDMHKYLIRYMVEQKHLMVLKWGFLAL